MNFTVDGPKPLDRTLEGEGLMLSNWLYAGSWQMAVMCPLLHAVVHVVGRSTAPQRFGLIQLSSALEDQMSELEMKTDIETEEFTDELSDEALDRDGAACNSHASLPVVEW